jgi:transposase InsO family protein
MEAPMSWGVKDVKGQRIAFVVRAVSGKENFSALCREFEVSRPTGYKWLKRYKANPELGKLEDKSRRPNHSPKRTKAAIERRVLAVRQETGWGAKKVQIVLAREDAIRIGRTTVNRILARNGLLREEDRHTSATRRFEMAAPNQLWQMDHKGPLPMGAGRCHPLSVLDDHSRYLIGLEAMASPQMEATERALIAMFETHGLPQAMLMDHGTAWWNPTNGHGLTRLSVMLIRQGIVLRYSGVRHPQTQGKVEKWHDTLRRAVRHHGRTPQDLAGWTELLSQIRQVYNDRRPHEALQMQVPAERYRVSPRRYQPHPVEWQYPARSIVKRVDCDGRISIFGGGRFISEALIGERVRVERFGTVALISYRHMYIREIYANGGSQQLICPIWQKSVQTDVAVEKQNSVFPQQLESSIHSSHRLDGH